MRRKRKRRTRRTASLHHLENGDNAKASATTGRGFLTAARDLSLYCALLSLATRFLDSAAILHPHLQDDVPPAAAADAYVEATRLVARASRCAFRYGMSLGGVVRDGWRRRSRRNMGLVAPTHPPALGKSISFRGTPRAYGG